MTKTTCKHLERDLPQVTDGDHPAYVSGPAMNSMTMSVFEVHFPVSDEEAFIQFLKNYGFVDPWDLDLLTAKYYRNLSVRDIAKEFNYVGKSEVHRRLKKLRALLVERGIEQELE